MNNDLFFSSKTDMWSTPRWLFDKYDNVYHFDLDVCATDENALCHNYFTKKEDGLSRKWYGNCWCNPPYGRSVGLWVKKAHDSVIYQDCNLVIMLLPARTDTRYFHDFIYGKFEIDFLKGRLKFGDSVNSAPFPSMIVKFYNIIK